MKRSWQQINPLNLGLSISGGNIPLQQVGLRPPAWLAVTEIGYLRRIVDPVVRSKNA